MQSSKAFHKQSKGLAGFFFCTFFCPVQGKLRRYFIVVCLVLR